MERVFITGRGLVTPLGNGLAANESALRSGKSGIVTVPDFIEHGIPCLVGGMPDQNNIEEGIDRKQLRFCSSVAVMSIAAAKQVFQEAGLDTNDLSHRNIALVGGVAGGNYAYVHDSAVIYNEHERRLRSVSPFAVPLTMPSCAISNLSLIFGLTGESFDVSAACASSAIAVMMAARLIRSGCYDMVLAGGAEQLDWIEALGFCACRALSTKYNETPSKASRPFDRGRDGFVLAGGAAYVLLESERSVKARGARAIAEVSGLAGNSNAKDMVVPDIAASASVMNAAIRDANLLPHQIDYVNTHGTGTYVGDPIELSAIHEVMGTRPAINSTKSQTGHMVGATGAAEVIFCSMMLDKGFISPSINIDDPDPECFKGDIVTSYRDGVNLKHALTNSFAFGGSNAALVLSKC